MDTHPRYTRWAVHWISLKIVIKVVIPPYLEVLDARRNLFNTELAAIQVRESQLNNVISLFQALGGGWPGSNPEPGRNSGEDAN